MRNRPSHISFQRWFDLSGHDHILSAGHIPTLGRLLIQRGPSFKQPVDTLIDASTGKVRVRYTEDKGKEKVVGQRIEPPPDVANGLLFTLMDEGASAALRFPWLWPK